MESYEDQLNEDISLAKKELENTTAELLPSYKHYSVLIKKLLNDSIQKVEKECRVHYEKIEKQKQESVLKAKEELKDKIVMYQQRADQIVEETKIENDKLFQGMSQRNQNEIERLKEKKVNLEQELLTLEAEQRALVDAINEDQYKYKSELNEIENQADERLEEIEKAYTDELKIVHQKLNERIEKIINEEEVEEDETYQEIDENTKQILRNENTRRIQILTEMQNEENNKIQELLSERQQKLSQFQSKMETAIAMAERKRIEEIENAERQYTIDREKLESDFEQEMKRLELLEEELIHNAKTIMNNEILSLEQSLEAKTKTSMTIDEDIEKYKCDCENVLANFIRNLSTETVEQFDQPKQIYCRIRQRIEIDFENNDEYLSIPSAKEVSIKLDPILSSEHYQFTQAFPSDSTMKELFKPIKYRLEKFMEGDNINLISCGTPYSGKSYLFEGRDQDGILFKSVKKLFKILKSLKNSGFTMEASILEDYMNEYYDFVTIASEENNTTIPFVIQLKPSYDDEGNLVIPEFQSIKINSYEEFIEIYENAMTRRVDSTESMPQHLSRTHLLTQLTITITDKLTQLTKKHTVNFIELASLGIEEIEEMEFKTKDEITWQNNSLSTIAKVLNDSNTKCNSNDLIAQLLIKNISNPNSQLLLFLNVPPSEKSLKVVRSSLEFASNLLPKNVDFSSKLITQE